MATQEWAVQATLLEKGEVAACPNEPNGDSHGSSVAISGSTVVIGADGGSTGQAFVFRRSGTTWSRQAELTGPRCRGGTGLEREWRP
jgi:FG-GAP repeat